MVLIANNKHYMLTTKKTTYYKYDTSNELVNLADSDNTTLITDGKIVTGSRYNWYTTETYNLTTPLKANKIYVNINTSSCQANAQISTTVTAITNTGEVQLYSNTYGYGVLPNESIECELPNETITTGFKIFVQSWARSGKYCYADFSVGVSSNKAQVSNSSNYDYYEDSVKKYLFARNGKLY